MALFQTMATQTTIFTHKRTVVLSVLLLAVIASGFPRVEIHTHPDAQFGHFHDVHDHDEPDGVNSGDVDELGNMGVMHAHEIGAPSLTLVPASDGDVVAHRRADGGIPPPTAKPPDIVIIPLYRPPIV